MFALTVKPNIVYSRKCLQYKSPLGFNLVRKNFFVNKAFGINVTKYENLIEPKAGYPLVYATLGLISFGFIGTFFIAPFFRDSFKEKEDWKYIYEFLIQNDIESIKPEDALKASNNGSVLIDVNLVDKYKNKSAKGSINFPLYQPIQGWSVSSNIRRAAFTFFGISGTERNPMWLEQIENSIPKNKTLMIMCDMGGSLIKKTGLNYGFQSRSLKAIYYLKKAGYNSVVHVEGGLSEWDRKGLPMNNS